MSRPSRVGLPWYAPENYAALRQALADGAKLPVQYEAWRISTEQVEREVQRSGVDVVRVPIELDAFMAWCRRMGLPTDGAARARYAADVLDEAPVRGLGHPQNRCARDGSGFRPSLPLVLSAFNSRSAITQKRISCPPQRPMRQAAFESIGGALIAGGLCPLGVGLSLFR